MDINNGTEFGTVKIITLKGEKGDAGQNGTSGDYSALSNKPSIGGVTLSGNKTASDLGLATSSTLASLANRIGDLETKLTLQKSDAIYPSNSVTIPSGQSGVVQFFVPPTVCDIAEYICACMKLAKFILPSGARTIIGAPFHVPAKGSPAKKL